MATSRKPAPRKRKLAAKRAPARARKPAARVAMVDDWRKPCGDAALRQGTGRDWAGWIAVIGRAGGAKLSHREIARLLHREHGVGGWWAQMVTVGYERATGRRAEHQKASGFAASVSRTLDASPTRVFDAWKSPSRRSRWIKEAFVIHKATRPRSLRITWTDGERCVGVWIEPASRGRAKLQVNHEKLASAAQVKKLKAYWAARLDALARSLAGS